MSRVIPLGRGGQYQAVVSDEDYAFLAQWRWSYKVSAWRYGRKVYARRSRRVGGRVATVYMHLVILTERMRRQRPSQAHTGHHRDTDSLNNQRSNLRWGSPSTQSREQKPCITAAERAAYDQQVAA